MVGYGVKNPWKPPVKKTVTSKPAAAPWQTYKLNKVLQSTGKNPVQGGPQTSAAGNQYTSMLRSGINYQSQQPGGGSTWWTNYLSPDQLSDLTLDPGKFKEAGSAFNATGAMPGQNPQYPGLYGGGGSRGGGGGGGGGGGPEGLDQEKFDYLAWMVGQGVPKEVAFEAIDIPEPVWNNALYNQARSGVETGIQGMRDRGNTAIDQARSMITSQYQNPFENGLNTRNPDLQQAMQRMASANAVQPGSFGATDQEATQRDRGMADTLAMLAGVDQRRQAGNLMGLEGDRRTMDQNLGLEGNLLGLGVNMAETKGKNAYDERVDAIRQQEAMQNWQRKNQVSDTNVGNWNNWSQAAIKAYMELVGAAPGVNLPAPGTMPWGNWPVQAASA